MRRTTNSWLSALAGYLAGRWPWPALFPLVLAGCATTSFETIDLDALPTAEDHPGEGAVVLLDDERLRFTTREGEVVSERTTHRRVKLLSEAGRSAMNLYVHYDRELSEVTEFEARILLPDGEEQVLDREEDLIDTMAVPGFVLYGSSRVLVFDNRSVPVGSVVEVRYTVRGRKPHLWQYRNGFGSSSPTKLARFEVRAPTSWELEHLARLRNQDIELAPEERVEGSPPERVWVWEERDLEPLPSLKAAPSWQFRVPMVLVRLRSWELGGQRHEPFPDVEAVSRWEAREAEDRLEIDGTVEEIHKEALARVPPGADERERAAHLYAWVRDKVRYCAVEVGLGGFIPHPSSRTADLRYGDCKDKANLLRALLAKDGIESRLASIYSHDGYPLRYGLPVVGGNANHMILVVDLDEGPVIVDPTTRLVPFGALPFGDQGADLAPSSHDGSPLMKSPLSAPDDNRETFVLEGELDDDGTFTADVGFEASGEIARRYRGQFLYRTLEQRDEALQALWDLGKREDVEPIELAQEAPPVEPTPLRGRARVTLRRAALGSGRTRVLRVADFLLQDRRALSLAGREESVVLGVPRVRSDKVVVALPAGMAVEQLPTPERVESAALDWSVSARAEEGKVVFERRVAVKKPVVEGEELAELARAYDEGRRLDGLAVVLSRYAKRSAPQAPPPPDPVEAPAAPAEASAPPAEVLK